MSILSKIFSKIFPGAHAAPAPGASSSSAAAPAAPTSQTAQTSTAGATPVQPMAVVDVAKVMEGLASQSSEKLNWKTSIVDLLKLLNLDSSLSARKELAGELGYTGDTEDSATMNIWLHKQVLAKIAANGGKLPADLAK